MTQKIQHFADRTAIRYDNLLLLLSLFHEFLKCQRVYNARFCIHIFTHISKEKKKVENIITLKNEKTNVCLGTSPDKCQIKMSIIIFEFREKNFKNHFQ